MTHRKNKHRKKQVPVKNTRVPVTRKQWIELIVTLMVMLLIMFGIGMCGVYKRKSQAKKRELHRAVTEGYVYDSYYSKGRSIRYTYTYKGEIYKTTQADSDRDFAIDNCYLVELDSLDPANALILHNEWISCRQKHKIEEE